MLPLPSLSLPWFARSAIQNKIWSHYVWTKYDYLCTDCDALYEITTQQTVPDCFEPQCACGSNKIISIGVSDGNAPVIYDVTDITPTQVVKIDSNPYN